MLNNSLGKIEPGINNLFNTYFFRPWEWKRAIPELNKFKEAESPSGPLNHFNPTVEPESGIHVEQAVCGHQHFVRDQFGEKAPTRLVSTDKWIGASMELWD
jgi:hypothetical protein